MRSIIKDEITPELKAFNPDCLRCYGGGGGSSTPPPPPPAPRKPIAASKVTQGYGQRKGRASTILTDPFADNTASNITTLLGG
jgi:hypothetical protein